MPYNCGTTLPASRKTIGGFEHCSGFDPVETDNRSFLLEPMFFVCAVGAGKPGAVFALMSHKRITW